MSDKEESAFERLHRNVKAARTHGENVPVTLRPTMKDGEIEGISVGRALFRRFYGGKD